MGLLFLGLEDWRETKGERREEKMPWGRWIMRTQLQVLTNWSKGGLNRT